MKTTIEQLIRQLEPGDHIRFESEDEALRRKPCTVEKVVLEGYDAEIRLAGPRTATYTLHLSKNGSARIFYHQTSDEKVSKGEIQWLSLVAGVEPPDYQQFE